MTAKAALCKLLLDGRVLNIKNCFTLVGLTNCPREISRMIEQPFSVVVSRTNMSGESRYGQAVTWVNYRLNSSEHNKEGIEKMKAYVLEQTKDQPEDNSIPVRAHTRNIKKEETNSRFVLGKLF